MRASLIGRPAKTGHAKVAPPPRPVIRAAPAPTLKPAPRPAAKPQSAASRPLHAAKSFANLVAVSHRPDDRLAAATDAMATAKTLAAEIHAAGTKARVPSGRAPLPSDPAARELVAFIRSRSQPPKPGDLVQAPNGIARLPPKNSVAAEMLRALAKARGETA